MIQYTAGTTKGATSKGDVLNNPFRLGDVDANYTSEAVVETAASAGSYVLSWTPVVKGAFTDESGTAYDVKLTHADGTVGYANVGTDGKTIVGSVNVGDRIAYRYDNVVIPQNDLPIVNAEMKSIPLVAKARRVAIYFSQIAAFQAKTDYGVDLGDQLAEKAVGQLQYKN